MFLFIYFWVIFVTFIDFQTVLTSEGSDVSWDYYPTLKVVVLIL